MISCQKQSGLRSKQPIELAITLLYVLFLHDNHFVKLASLQKDSGFYVLGKTIHSQAKYIIIDHFDQETKNNEW